MQNLSKLFSSKTVIATVLLSSVSVFILATSSATVSASAAETSGFQDVGICALQLEGQTC